MKTNKIRDLLLTIGKDIWRNPTAMSLFAMTFDNAVPKPSGKFNIVNK